MTREALARLASAWRLVDPTAPQHGVDEPHQLPGRQHERPPMLVARRLMKLLVVVGTELRTREPNRVGSLDHVVAQVSVPSFGQRTLLSLELTRLMAPPGEPRELRQRFLAFESAHVPDLGDDAGGEDRTQTRDGGERLGRGSGKLGGYGLLYGFELGTERPYSGKRGGQDEVHGLDHRLRQAVGAPCGLLYGLGPSSGSATLPRECSLTREAKSSMGAAAISSGVR